MIPSLFVLLFMGCSLNSDREQMAGSPVGVTSQEAQPASGPPTSMPNIVLLSLDTTRADHMKTYGYPRQTTPNLDALAARSIVFERAYAPAPVTLPSHVSIFTGTAPTEHGVLTNVLRGGERFFCLLKSLPPLPFTPRRLAIIRPALSAGPRFGLGWGWPRGSTIGTRCHKGRRNAGPRRL